MGTLSQREHDILWTDLRKSRDFPSSFEQHDYYALNQGLFLCFCSIVRRRIDAETHDLSFPKEPE